MVIGTGVTQFVPGSSQLEIRCKKSLSIAIIWNYKNKPKIFGFWRSMKLTSIISIGGCRYRYKVWAPCQYYNNKIRLFFAEKYFVNKTNSSSSVKTLFFSKDLISKKPPFIIFLEMEIRMKPGNFQLHYLNTIFR